MIKKWIVTGDNHGDTRKFKFIEYDGNPSEVAIVILGDAGCNYYHKKKSHWIKMNFEKFGFHFYLVRGNHEERPENLPGIKSVYDENVLGDVFEEDAYPHIHYLKDGNTYSIDGHKTLVIGGAYSIDKLYRLQMDYPWFPQEQLDSKEMLHIEENVKGQSFDFVLSHTCPLSWEPQDLFLTAVNQSAVDKSMEKWMDSLKDKISWKVWLFGHFHADRIERKGVEIYYNYLEEFSTIWNRWTSDDEIEWYLQKSPYYNN